MLAQMCLLYYPLRLSAFKRVLESSLCSEKTRGLVGETDVQTVITSGDRHFIWPHLSLCLRQRLMGKWHFNNSGRNPVSESPARPLSIHTVASLPPRKSKAFSLRFCPLCTFSSPNPLHQSLELVPFLGLRKGC